MPTENTIRVIFPYRTNGVWAFDDPAVGLRNEPFICGSPAIIDSLVADIPDANAGFTLYFSDCPFPGFQNKLDWVREEGGGNWYRIAGSGAEGWLCPALFKYFSKTPKALYVKAEAAEA